MVIINNVFLFAFSVAMALVMGEWSRFAVTTAIFNMTGVTAIAILCSCVTGASLGYIAFIAQRNLSATAMQVLINMNKLGVIAFERLYFADPLSPSAIGGLAAGLGGGMLYSIAAMPSRKKELDAAKHMEKASQRSMT